jgi:hypothetical protein
MRGLWPLFGDERNEKIGNIAVKGVHLPGGLLVRSEIGWGSEPWKEAN